MKPYSNYCLYERGNMTHRFLIFLAMVASVISMMLFCPANALCIMSKEILISFNNGGMDLLPDVRVINTEGSVTYTITIKGQKKEGDDIYTADLTAEEKHTRNSAKARVNYRAWGKYVYDLKAYDDKGRPCRSVTTLNIQDDISHRCRYNEQIQNRRQFGSQGRNLPAQLRKDEVEAGTDADRTDSGNHRG